MTAQPLTLGIDHIGLTVRDLNLTRDFFVSCLGWIKIEERPDYPAAFVSDGHVMLMLWEVQNQSGRVEFDRKTNVGPHHFALRVGSEAALVDVFSKVSKRPGVEVQFAPETLGAGPKGHTMIFEPGGIRLDFDFDSRVSATQARTRLTASLLL